MHCALIVEEDSMCAQATGVVIHVLRYLMKARAWSGLGVAVVFVVGIGFVFYLSVALFCFVAGVNT